MAKNTKTRVEVNSREGFYIGDICYVLPSSIYQGIFQEGDGFHDGLVKVSDDESGIGCSFAVGGTNYGDGTYYDEAGNEYPVDAGVIGLVPLELVTEQTYRNGFTLGRIVRLPGRAVFEVSQGIFDITLPDGERVFIDTRESDDDYFDDYDEEDYIWTYIMA